MTDIHHAFADEVLTLSVEGVPEASQNFTVFADYLEHVPFTISKALSVSKVVNFVLMVKDIYLRSPARIHPPSTLDRLDKYIELQIA